MYQLCNLGGILPGRPPCSLSPFPYSTYTRKLRFCGIFKLCSWFFTTILSTFLLNQVLHREGGPSSVTLDSTSVSTLQNWLSWRNILSSTLKIPNRFRRFPGQASRQGHTTPHSIVRPLEVVPIFHLRFLNFQFIFLKSSLLTISFSLPFIYVVAVLRCM